MPKVFTADGPRAAQEIQQKVEAWQRRRAAAQAERERVKSRNAPLSPPRAGHSAGDGTTVPEDRS